MAYDSKSIGSKWRKTKWLLKDDLLKTYVPDTLRFTRANLHTIMIRHPVVYFKPSRGSGGNRIMKIERSPSQTYITYYLNHKQTYSNIQSLYTQLKSFAKGKTFLLQRGINLATVKGNPFDLRVMVQKPDDGKWLVSAMFVKIGRSGKVVNNYNQGGKLANFNTTLKKANYTEDEIQSVNRQLVDMGEQTGKCFDKHYEGFRELGIDVAIDQSNKLWILEVNTRPQFYPLKRVNKALFNTIAGYAKQYGRIVK